MSVFTNSAAEAKAASGAYSRAILELLGGRDPIAVLRDTPATLYRMVRDRPVDVMRRPEAPGKWSAVEVVQHLADSDLVWAYRLRLVLAEDRPTLTGYDQDRWADELRYRELDPDAAVEGFVSLRRLNLRLLNALRPEDLARVGVHSDRGEERVDHMIKLYAGHDLVHLRQLERVLP